MDAIVGLFALLVADIGAATITEYQQDTRFPFLFLYSFVAFVAWVPICMIVGSVAAGGGAVFKQDFSALRIGRWLLLWATIATIAFPLLAGFNMWPGQARPVPPKISEVAAFELTPTAPGIRLQVVVTGAQFQDGIPLETVLLLSLSEDIAKRWQFFSAEVYENNAGETLRVSAPSTVYGPSLMRPGAVRARIRFEEEAAGEYLVELYLMPIEWAQIVESSLSPAQKAAKLKEIQDKIETDRTETIKKLESMDDVDVSFEE